MNTSSTPGIKEIAAAAGVHHSTVSRALRDSPLIPEATRRRIRQLAERMDYRPHPLVTALMTYRTRHQRPAHQAEIAYVNSYATRDGWWRNGSPAYQKMYLGAKARAESQGFKLEPIWRNEPGMTGARYTRILAARGITGLLIAPVGEPEREIDLDWDNFCAVDLGYTLRAPEIHRAVNDYFHSMRTALRHARELGYRRIGLVLREITDRRVHHLWRAAYLDEQRERPAADRVEPLLLAEWSLDALANWHHRERPDVIVGIEMIYLMPLLKSLRMRVPRDIGVINLSCYDRTGEYAGIYQNFEGIGAAAIDLLTGMIFRNQRGIPEQASHVLINGVWVDGKTVHRQHAAPAPRRHRRAGCCP